MGGCFRVESGIVNEAVDGEVVVASPWPVRCVAVGEESAGEFRSATFGPVLTTGEDGILVSGSLAAAGAARGFA